MKGQKLLSTSVLVEAVSVALKSLEENEEERANVIEKLQSSIDYVQKHPKPIAVLKEKVKMKV